MTSELAVQIGEQLEALGSTIHVRVVVIFGGVGMRSIPRHACPSASS